MKAFHLPEVRAFLRYIEIPGDDPPLLWLYGWHCTSTGELMPAAVQAPLRGRHSFLIDLLGHGYSMGGGIAVPVSAARPGIVSLLFMAEGAIDASGHAPFDGQTESRSSNTALPICFRARSRMRRHTSTACKPRTSGSRGGLPERWNDSVHSRAPGDSEDAALVPSGRGERSGERP